ncbi:MAG: winged helix-turn-helix domain-containing protein, partial [Hyphomicrobium sp.]|nr:winged helix-turn-helix domain-containing protein [Hyphomicrobium sp.]
MLQLFLANPGRVLSKQELIEAIWPNLHVGEDNLFQCIREIRAALGDDRRQLIKLVSGRGYVFEAEVSSEPAPLARVAEPPPAVAPVAEERPNRAASSDVRAAPAPDRFRFGMNRWTALAAVAALVAVMGLGFAASILAPGLLAGRMPPTVTVMPIVGAGNDLQVAEMATSVTDRLGNALARIETIRVVAPRSDATPGSPATVRSAPGDFVVTGELQRAERSWRIEARMRDAAGEVKWTAAVSVDIEDAELSLQQSRLAAGLGHSLALRINALHHAGAGSAPAGAAKVVIEQAMASIAQTTPERFRAAQALLEKATAAEPDNVDLKAALAAHLLRGIQLAWYDPADI